MSADFSANLIDHRDTWHTWEPILFYVWAIPNEDCRRHFLWHRGRFMQHDLHAYVGRYHRAACVGSECKGHATVVVPGPFAHRNAVVRRKVLRFPNRLEQTTGLPLAT